MKRSHEEERIPAKRFDSETYSFDYEGYKKHEQAQFELLVSKLKEKKQTLSAPKVPKRKIEEEKTDNVILDEWRMKGF
jgi:hypothetical protein